MERVEDECALCRQTALAVSRDEVVGWFQGRMEWGPRALGNRSIVCDPRRADMKDILNLSVQVCQIREEERSLIPAVTDVDGSERLQTDYAHTNPCQNELICAFPDLTGIPMVLNPSFNKNEPVVGHPTEALQCFLRTEMDMLVIGDWVVSHSRTDGD